VRIGGLVEEQMQGTQLRYAIKFVADMDKAVKFDRDVLGLKVKFESPGWSEFVKGDTTLALHRLPIRSRQEKPNRVSHSPMSRLFTRT
jgi:catechol 2,3-dioxygenase-like lactoylglutathione lyase family enzyme